MSLKYKYEAFQSCCVVLAFNIFLVLYGRSKYDAASTTAKLRLHTEVEELYRQYF